MPLSVVLLVSTACSGVLNPPGPPPTPLPLPTRPTSTPQPTTTPEPELWIKNHSITDMWSGPEGDSGVVSFGKTSSRFCLFRVEREQDNPRLFVYNPYNDGHFWIDSRDIGPVESVDVLPGPKPPGQNCASALYDPSLPAPATSTPQTTPTTTPVPASGARREQPLVLAQYDTWYDLAAWDSGRRPISPSSRADRPIPR